MTVAFDIVHQKNKLFKTQDFAIIIFWLKKCEKRKRLQT